MRILEGTNFYFLGDLYRYIRIEPVGFQFCVIMELDGELLVSDCGQDLDDVQDFF
ncbi:hypothetical protein BY996DRAFT_6537864 [Phakopsora pachyrhizi]|nr:hypothetical protein BY996DRAFT_6537864 [Phakopsora pachyrhizi]